MAAVRGKNNRAETALRKALWRRGYRYVLYDRKLPGTPDLVFRRQRVAVFVDGDFWHGRVLRENGPEALARSFRTVRREYWVAKIHRNSSRDLRTTSELAELGYKVLRLWEKDVLKDVANAANIVERALRNVRTRKRALNGTAGERKKRIGSRDRAHNRGK
jgi:DNA mismatch endonuclease, patch repair protein